MEDGGAILSPLFLAVKSTPTFTSYFPSLGPGFFGCVLRGLHNLGPVSLWRENTEDLVTRMRGGSEGILSVRRGLLHLLYWDRGGRGRNNVQSGSDDDWFHFGHLDHTRFGGWKTGGDLHSVIN